MIRTLDRILKPEYSVRSAGKHVTENRKSSGSCCGKVVQLRGGADSDNTLQAIRILLLSFDGDSIRRVRDLVEDRAVELRTREAMAANV